MASPLYSLHDHALMAGAGTGDPTGNDLTALGHELGTITPQNHLFIIDECRFVHAKHTDFATGFTKLAWLAARFAG